MRQYTASPRPGRSTDCGDAVVLAFWSDPRALRAQLIGQKVTAVQPYGQEGARLFAPRRTERDWAAIARGKWTKASGRTAGGRRVTY